MMGGGTPREQQAESLASITCRDVPDESYSAVLQSSPQLHLRLSSCFSDVSNTPIPLLPQPPLPKSRIPSCHCCASIMRRHCSTDTAALLSVYLSPRLFMHGFICLLIWIHSEMKHTRAFLPGLSLFSHGTHPYIISLGAFQAKCSDAV